MLVYTLYMKNSILIPRNKRLIFFFFFFWTRRIVELTASCLVGAVDPVIFSNLFLLFPLGQRKEENFLLLGSFGFSSFSFCFVCLVLLCLRVAMYAVSLALRSGGWATGMLGAICFRKKEGMESTPAFYWGTETSLSSKFTHIIFGKTAEHLESLQLKPTRWKL